MVQLSGLFCTRDPGFGMKNIMDLSLYSTLSRRMNVGGSSSRANSNGYAGTRRTHGYGTATSSNGVTAFSNGGGGGGGGPKAPSNKLQAPPR